MNYPQKPFCINTGFMINQPIGYEREIPFKLPRYEFDGDFDVNDLEGTIILNRTQSGLRTFGEFSATIEAECVRCLEIFLQGINTSFEELFTFNRKEISEDEQLIPEDGFIDFEALLRDYLLLALPISPICRADCLGLCSICGENLNQRTCSHHQGSNNHNELLQPDGAGGHLGKGKGSTAQF